MTLGRHVRKYTDVKVALSRRARCHIGFKVSVREGSEIRFI